MFMRLSRDLALSLCALKKSRDCDDDVSSILDYGRFLEITNSFVVMKEEGRKTATYLVGRRPEETTDAATAVRRSPRLMKTDDDRRTMAVTATDRCPPYVRSSTFRPRLSQRLIGKSSSSVSSSCSFAFSFWYSSFFFYSSLLYTPVLLFFFFCFSFSYFLVFFLLFPFFI